MVDHSKTGSQTVRLPPSSTHPDGVELTFTPDRLEPGLKCCEARAAMWSGNASASVTQNLANGREGQFRMQCQSACRASFGGR